MALAPNALLSVEELRTWLTGQTVEATTGRLDASLLEPLIASATAAIEAHCDRRLRAPTAAEVYTFDGHGEARWLLPEWPIVELSAVTVDGVAIPARDSLVSSGYLVSPREGWVDLVGYRFTRGRGNCTVTARCGFDPALAAAGDWQHRRALDDLAQACRLLCAAWWEESAGRLMVPAGAEPPAGPAELPLPVRGLLRAYRRQGA